MSPRVPEVTNTQELTARLRRHYIKPGGMAGGIFVEEVGQNGAWGASRRVDALYVGFTSASGRTLVGHEIKVSRSDWLHELDNLHKADAWADQCHQWYLVTLPNIVRPGELPEGWGHMVPSTRTATRMDILVPATSKPQGFEPGWNAVRSIMARQDTLTSAEVQKRVGAEIHSERQRMEVEYQRRLEQERQRQPDVAALQDEVARYRRALGPLAADADSAYGRQVSEEALTDLAQVLAETRDVREAVNNLAGRYSPIDVLDRRVGELRAALDALAGRDQQRQEGAE